MAAYAIGQVVFSTAHWIGKMAENKDEHKSDWPNDILHTYQDGQLSVFALPSPIAITGTNPTIVMYLHRLQSSQAHWLSKTISDIWVHINIHGERLTEC